MTEGSCVILGSFSDCQRIRRNSGTGMDGVTRVIVDQVGFILSLPPAYAGR